MRKRFLTPVRSAVRIFLALAVVTSAVSAADWPMWRHNPGRTAATDASLPEQLNLKWVRELHPNAPAYKDQRLQFDRGYEPIVLGSRIVVASAVDDSVTAFDTETGAQLWKFFAEGPVRFAPVGGKGRIIFGSDDGCVYCVRASSGELVWKFKAVPSNRRLLGNGRLISVWPVRGGPVLKDERVYFAAGVWPLEGVFVFCLDAATGTVVWRNDRMSYLFGQQPHNTEGFGGLAPQGYLVIDGDELVVPCSVAYPARLDLTTGKLKDFQLPSPGRLTGGWFASTPSEKEQARLKRRGLLFDEAISRKRHEDRPRSVGLPGIRSTIHVGDREFKFPDGHPGVDGEVHSMLAAADNLFVVTLDGLIYCFGETDGSARRYPMEDAPAAVDSRRARELLQASDAQHGYAVVLGLDGADVLQSLVMKTNLDVIGVDADPAIVATLRRTAALPATRLSLHVADPLTFEMPKYFANLISINEAYDADVLGRLYESLRPYGGCLVGVPAGMRSAAAKLEGVSIADGLATDELTLTRDAALPGATNYLGDWKTRADERVRAPVGVLWFGDSVSHFKRSPQPAFIDGVMVSVDKDWLDASNRRGGKDYKLLEPVLSDVYTGRVFTKSESADLRRHIADVARKSIVDHTTVQPSQYRPPGQAAIANKTGLAGIRINPLTGAKEPRSFPKRYGCDGGIDYGALFTMRSATAAFYDKQLESGTINISGPRSGCTNSIIPANGLLNVPYFYEGCTCSYPLPMAVSLVSMPEDFEQWASWGHVPFEQLDGKIRRLGLNLGAPGDRKTRDGTLWLNHPDTGGPSPQLRVSTVPKSPEYVYQHSLFVRDREPWPWVAASGVRNLRELSIDGIKPGTYSVRLVFLAPSDNQSSFEVSLNGHDRPAIAGRDPGSDGPHAVQSTISGVEIDNSLNLTLRVVPRDALLCGIEVVPE